MFEAWLCTQKMESRLPLMLQTELGWLSSVGEEYVPRYSAGLGHLLLVCVGIFMY